VEFVTYEMTGDVGVIALNRPPVNALNAELIADLGTAIGKAAEPAARAVVITGSPHFAAGADITGFQRAFESGAQERQASGLAEVIAGLEALEKPTIAAVRGFALGGGLELSMGADFRFLAEGAKVGQPEILLGIIPGAGGTQRLARIVGPQRCKELCMSGRHIGAEEALAIGLADEVFPDADLEERTMEAAQRFAAGPTVAYAAVKAAITAGFGEPIDRAVEIESEQFDRTFRTEDARIGVRAFLAKEKPTFTGQ